MRRQKSGSARKENSGAQRRLVCEASDKNAPQSAGVSTPVVIRPVVDDQDAAPTRPVHAVLHAHSPFLEQVATYLVGGGEVPARGEPDDDERGDRGGDGQHISS